MPATTVPATLRELVTSGTLEMGAHRPQDAEVIAGHLPRGTQVFVNHLPRHGLKQTLASAIAARAAGLDPVPHLAARRITARQEAERFLGDAAREAGVHRLLLIGGDVPDPAGPYRDTNALLADGLIAGAGIREIAFAAYPEGHAHIAKDILARSLAERLELSARQGLGASIVTQFTFAPHRTLELAADLHRTWPNVPVYVGVPGPMSPAALLKFAETCGVSASLRALSAAGMGAVRLLTHTDPAEQLSAIAQHLAAGLAPNIVGAHIYSFGSAERAAAWMNGVLRSA
jgi:methylenetetrahydrofolate reductase (NADPH)